MGAVDAPVTVLERGRIRGLRERETPLAELDVLDATLRMEGGRWTVTLSPAGSIAGGGDGASVEDMEAHNNGDGSACESAARVWSLVPEINYIHQPS